MSTRRLSPSEVEHYVVALDSFISQGMKDRLLALTEIMDDDGFVRLDRALERAVSPGAKDKMRAFRQFRQRLRKASVAAQIGFHLPVDDQWSKSAPHTRYCWFVVEEFTDQCALTVPSNNRRPGPPQTVMGPVGGHHTGERLGAPGLAPVGPDSVQAPAVPVVARHTGRDAGSPWVRSAMRQQPAFRDGGVEQGNSVGRAATRPPHGTDSGVGVVNRPRHEAAYASAHVADVSEVAGAQRGSMPLDEAVARGHEMQHGEQTRRPTAPVVGRVYVATGTDLQPAEAHAVDEFVRELGVALIQQADYPPAVRCSWHLQLGVDALEERERLCRFADRAVVLVTPRMLRETYLEWPEISQVPHAVVQVSPVGDSLRGQDFDMAPVVNPTEALAQMPPRSMRRVAHQVAAAVLGSGDAAEVRGHTESLEDSGVGGHAAEAGRYVGEVLPEGIEVRSQDVVPDCGDRREARCDDGPAVAEASDTAHRGTRLGGASHHVLPASSTLTQSGHGHRGTPGVGGDVPVHRVAPAGRVVQPRNWTARSAGSPSRGGSGRAVGGDDCEDSDRGAGAAHQVTRPAHSTRQSTAEHRQTGTEFRPRDAAVRDRRARAGGAFRGRRLWAAGGYPARLT